MQTNPLAEKDSAFQSSSTIPMDGSDFVCPSDGYLAINILNGKEIDVFIHSGGNPVRHDVKNVTGTGNYYCVFVKKGLKVHCTYTAEQGSVTFRGLA